MMTLTMFIFINDDDDDEEEDDDDLEGNKDENDIMPLTMHHKIIIRMIVFLITLKEKSIQKIIAKIICDLVMYCKGSKD